MANRKEYEMLFQLSANLDNNFNTSFSKAVAQLSSMQKEVISLQKTIGTVTAYEKLEKTIQTNENRLENYRAKLEEVKNGLTQEGAETEILTLKKEKLEKTIANLELKIDEQKQKLSEEGVALEKDGVDVDKLAEEHKRLEERLEETKREMENVAEATVENAEAMKDAKLDVEDLADAIATIGLVKALKKLAEAYKECIEISQNFGWEMANVRALADANDTQFEQLTEKAKELGATTKFTATESAEAMGFMAMAGWKTNEMLEGMDAVITLAAAANEDLATTSSIVTDSLNAFGLKASDAARFADVLAAGATNSNTTVSLMGETFKYAAASAGALGYTIEDMAVAMGVMANRGIKGNMAGTSLRLTMAKLAAGATLTGEAIGDYEYSSIRADGTMKSFKETLDELRGVFSQLTEQEKIINAQNIAGTRSYNGLLAMINASEDEYTRLAEVINNSAGAAEKMASVKLDSQKGDWYIMTSAADALKTTLGEINEDEIRDIYVGLTNIIDELNAFVKDNPAEVKAIATLVTGLLSFTTAITGVAAGVKIFGAVSKVVTAVFGTALGPIAAVVAALTAVGATAVYVTEEYERLVKSAIELNEAAEETHSVMGQASRSLDEDTASMEANAAVVANLVARLKELKETEGGEESTEWTATLTAITSIFPELTDKIDTTTGSIEGGIEALERYVEEQKKSAKEMAYLKYRETLEEQYTDILVKRAKVETDLAKSEALLKVYQKEREDIEPELAALNLKKQQGEITREENKRWNELVDKAQEYNALINTEKIKQDAYNESLSKSSDELAQIEDECNTAKETYDELYGIVEKNTQANEEAESSYVNLSEELGKFSEALEGLEKEYTNAYDAAYKSITGQFKLFEEADELEEQSAEDFNKALESQAQYWAEYNTNLSELEKKSGSIKGLRDLLKGVADGSPESANALAGMAKASDEELKKMADSYAALTENQGTLSTNIAELETEYKARLKALADDFDDAVTSWNLSDEAYEASKATVDAFIEGFEDEEDKVIARFQRFHDLASAYLLPGAGYIAPKYNYGHGDTSGYADGTSFATRGWHLVGENGPELLHFNGGEQVIPHSASMDALSSGFGGINLQIDINVEGNADDSTVDRLGSVADELAERVLAIISDAQSDSERRVFA